MNTVLSSRDPLYINHYKSIFEQMWASGQEAEDRIKDIERGLDDNNISIIYDPREVVNRGRDYFQNAKKEIQILLPSCNTLIRLEKYSDFWFFNTLAAKGIKVRVLLPIAPEVTKINNIILSYPLIEFRTLPFTLPYLVSTAIIDKEIVMSSEKNNDHKSRYDDVIKCGIFINSKQTAITYSSIFDTLWTQTELYKKLQINDKIQQEFVNVAAHELRTPVQSIMGYTAILQKELKGSKQYDQHFKAIRKNTERIRNLVNRLLDVTQIENNRLALIKERFDINSLIQDIVNEYRIKIKETGDYKTKLLYVSSEDRSNSSILVFADKIKIFQVINNLLDNAIEFSKYNQSKTKDYQSIVKITTQINKKRLPNYNRMHKELVVNIIDNGPGIHKEILPSLFTKFLTKSANGTGLGLYFSKNIIEKHGGRIWAKNNEDGEGATFSFSIPLDLK
jgi:signal transduction histidine kinase